MAEYAAAVLGFEHRQLRPVRRTRLMATTPESKVKAAVRQWLKARKVWHFMPVSNGMGQMGIPDIIACYDGRFLAIETKAPGKRGNTTPLQKRQLQGIADSNGLAIVVDDATQLDELAAGLERLKHGTT